MSAQALFGTGNQTQAHSNSGVGATLTLARPANTVVGDHLMAVVMMRSDTAAPIPPAGWKLLAEPNWDGTPPALGWLTVYYRHISTLVELPTEWTWQAQAGGRKTATIFRITGAHIRDFEGEIGKPRFVEAVQPVMKFNGFEPTAPQSLMIAVAGINTTANPTITDEFGMTWATPVSTTTGATETILRVGAVSLPNNDAFDMNRTEMTPVPPSGLGYMFTIRTKDIPPYLLLGSVGRRDSGELVSMQAYMKYGVADSWEWRQTSGPTAPFVTHNGRLQFLAPMPQDFVSYDFQVRATDHNNGNPVTSNWVDGHVEIRPHPTWKSRSGGGWDPTIFGNLEVWYKGKDGMEGQWHRPGEVYIPEGVTVPELLAKESFFVAHRGSGDEFPEHTLEAYQGVLAAGGDAVEVSVMPTADGQLVCFHDDTLDRITDSTGIIWERTYQDLYDNVRVVQAGHLGPAQPPVRIPLLRDVLDELAGKRVIFIESKHGLATMPLFEMLDGYAKRGMNLGDWFVYKLFYQGGTVAKAMAHDRGMLVWGYLESATDAEMDAEEYRVDLWGVPDFMPLARKAEVVARGKPTICWQVHRRAQVDEHRSIGLQGNMSSGLLYCYQNARLRDRDNFASERKSHGDLWTANIVINNIALAYDGEGNGYHKFPDPICSTVMGSMCPTPSTNYRVRGEMLWKALANSGEAGIAFACPNDEPFRPTTADSWINKTGGYYATLSPNNGLISLYKYAPGTWAPTLLNSSTIPGYTQGAGIQLTVEVEGSTVRVKANGTTRATATDTTYRGGYFHIAQGTVNQLTHYNTLRLENL